MHNKIQDRERKDVRENIEAPKEINVTKIGLPAMHGHCLSYSKRIIPLL